MLRYKIARKYLYSTLALSLLLVYFWLGKTNQNKSKSLKPYIFVSGYQRSGTTLMRAILDVHPNIKCGPETKIIIFFLKFLNDFKKNTLVNLDLKNSNIEQSLIDQATIEFISYVMDNRGLKASRICSKDPSSFLYIEHLNALFPKSKLIYMVRDGRAATVSKMKHTKVDINNPKIRKKYFQDWVDFNKIASEGCVKIGVEFCLIVRYEDLVLHPEKELRKIMLFLDEKWSDELLKHQNHIGKEIYVSKTEWSSHQIIKPINSESINEWVKITNITEKEMELFKPMLQYFNYSLNSNDLNYEKADYLVAENNEKIKKQKKFFYKMAWNLSDHFKKL